MKRQTSYSLGELISLLTSGSHSRPCLLVNEIGVTMLTSEDKDQVAEKHLVSLLTDESEGIRAIAFTFLSIKSEIAERNSNALKVFEENPDNGELMPSINEHLGR